MTFDRYIVILRRCGLLFFLLAFGQALAITPTLAQAPAPAPNASSPVAPTAYAPVMVDSRKLFVVTGDGSLSASERADRINRRLATLVSLPDPVPPFKPENVLTRNGQTIIRLGDQVIMSVTESDAQDALTTPHDLALVWGGKLSRAVADARLASSHPLHGVGVLIKNSFKDMLLSGAAWLPRLVGAIVVMISFWLLSHLASWLVRQVGQRAHANPNLRQLARAVAVYGTWTVGFVAILSVLGFQGGSILTAFGVSGFVLGFAFKDILSHFLAGLMLLVGQSLRIGDQIVVNQYEGTVERIELRALYLRTYDNRLVIIPNGEVFTSVVTSNTASPHRRRDFVVNIDYSTDIEQAQRIAVETITSVEGVQPSPPPEVLVHELGTSNIALMLRFYTSSLRADYLKVGSECMRQVKMAFEQKGIGMPDGATTITIRNLPELTAALQQTANSQRPPE